MTIERIQTAVVVPDVAESFRNKLANSSAFGKVDSPMIVDDSMQQRIAEQIRQQRANGNETFAIGPNGTQTFATEAEALAYMRKQKRPPVTLSGMKEMYKNRRKSSRKKR